MNRQDANLEIIEVLKMATLMYKDLRFTQIMSAVDLIQYQTDTLNGGMVIKDEYYTESIPLLKRVTIALDKLVAEQSKRESL